MPFPTPVKKIFADVWTNKTRSLLAALSIAVGVFAVGVLVCAATITKRDLDADYFAVNPHTARLYCQDFDNTLLRTLRGLPEVESVGASYNLWLKVASAGGQLHPINLNSLVALDAVVVDRLVFETGARTLGNGEIYLERQGAEGLGLKPGDPVALALADGRTLTLKLAGTVHDVQANPYKFNGYTSGFVTPATMEKLGGSRLNNFVNLVTTGAHADAAHVERLAHRVADRLTAAGYTVNNVNVNRPGQPPAQATVNTVMALMGVLSVLVVALSAFLVTNTVSALLAQQIRQIGVMKALGATLWQVLGLYLGLVLAFGALALLMAVPLSVLAGYGLTHWLLGMLNANPTPFSYPPQALALQLALALAVPVLAALAPVLGGARRTVREALASYGLEAAGKPGRFDARLERRPWLPRPLLLSLRNTFRRKARLALTLATLVLGGAIFIAMLGVREAMYAEIAQALAYFQSDVSAAFPRPYPAAKLQAAVAGLPGVAAAEAWNSFTANVVRPDGETTDLVAIYVPPVDTRLVRPVLTAGRWLRAGDTRAIVVSNHFIGKRPEVQVGDTLLLRWQEKDTPLQVVGVFRVAGNFPAPLMYLSPETLATLDGHPRLANEFKLLTDQPTPARQAEVLKRVQAQFTALGLDATLQTGSELLAQQHAVIDILISLLMTMGLLIAVVGGLGLMGTMSMNVMERTREIGVLRSIGARNGQIFQLVLVEGLLTGGLSALGSALVAVPMTQLLDLTLGRALMTVPLVYVFSLQGLCTWLALVLALSALASLWPARHAVRLTVREVLAYQ